MLAMRPATEADRWKVFEWRNRADLYAVGNTPRPVEKAEHDAWFSDVLTGTNIKLWILEPDAGTVRLDLGSQMAWLTIYLLPEFQGKGHGTEIIRAACKLGFKESPWLREIRAAVHADNDKSIKAFTKAGFHLELVKCP